MQSYLLGDVERLRGEWWGFFFFFQKGRKSSVTNRAYLLHHYICTSGLLHRFMYRTSLLQLSFLSTCHWLPLHAWLRALEHVIWCNFKLFTCSDVWKVASQPWPAKTWFMLFSRRKNWKEQSIFAVFSQHYFSLIYAPFIIPTIFCLCMVIFGKGEHGLSGAVKSKFSVHDKTLDFYFTRDSCFNPDFCCLL